MSSNLLKPPIAVMVSSPKDPNHFPPSGSTIAARCLADRVNGRSVMDTWLPWDQARSRIAPNILLLMLVINVLWHRNPLYRVENWAATMPLPLLWSDQIQDSQCNIVRWGASWKTSPSTVRGFWPRWACVCKAFIPQMAFCYYRVFPDGRLSLGSVDAEQATILLLESVDCRWHAPTPIIEAREVTVKYRERPKARGPSRNTHRVSGEHTGPCLRARTDSGSTETALHVHSRNERHDARRKDGSDHIMVQI